jgi:hypothetical protein
MPWSSGPVEGRVNHIKMIKRQMSGRAGLPLLASVSCSLPGADRSEDLSQLPAVAGKWRRVIGGGELAPAGRFVS